MRLFDFVKADVTLYFPNSGLPLEVELRGCYCHPQPDVGVTWPHVENCEIFYRSNGMPVGKMVYDYFMKHDRSYIEQHLLDEVER